MKDRLYLFLQWQYSGIMVLVVIIAALHFSTLLMPPEQVFDEQYYVPAADSIIRGSGTDRTEHPPLGQVLIASGIRIFGDNPAGWRTFPVLFGLAGISLFYLICLRLDLSRKYSFLAAFLLAFENLSFIQSSLAMLDVFCLTFMLAAFWFFLKGNRFVPGIMIALAALSKLTGLLALPVILMHWLIDRRKDLKYPLIHTAVTAVAFFLLMPLFDFIIWHRWLNPFSQLSTMLQINSGSTFARYPSEMLSRPWDWIIRPEILTYWIDPHYLAMVSPTLWVMIIPAVAFVVYRATKKSRAAVFALAWFTFLYVIWIPASLAGDRTSYIYYFYPAIGSVCVGLVLLAGGLTEMSGKWQERRWKKAADLVIPIYLLLSLGAFVILSPVSYWWKVPLCIAAYLFTRYYISEKGTRQPYIFYPDGKEVKQ
ncbi:MAG: glycosyltransferase family 39 protein [Dehalococcoidales bacterium]|nr:glycosyltransferase family 39 protein [Dehalococcoidales bacterium]